MVLPADALECKKNLALIFNFQCILFAAQLSLHLVQYLFRAHCAQLPYHHHHPVLWRLFDFGAISYWLFRTRAQEFESCAGEWKKMADACEIGKLVLH